MMSVPAFKCCSCSPTERVVGRNRIGGGKGQGRGKDKMQEEKGEVRGDGEERERGSNIK